MRDKLLMILAAFALAGLIAGCGAGNSLTTGSLTGSGQKAEAAPKPVTPSDRSLYVAATVARAQRCGFYFEPEQVKANYLAAEQQAGTPPDLMQKLTREFDQTRQAIVTAAAKDEDYCTERRTSDVKAALTRHLAGDFNPPQRRQEVNVGLFDHQSKGKAFDGEAVFEKAGRPQPTSIGGN